MPETAECPRCRNARFVRLEHVVKGGQSERHYYCGAWDYSWVDAAATGVHSDDIERPDRSRPSELPTAKRRRATPEREAPRRTRRS